MAGISLPFVALTTLCLALVASGHRLDHVEMSPLEASVPLEVVEPDQILTPPENWKVIERAGPSVRVNLVFAMKHENEEILENLLMKVSDPKSQYYGHHLSLDQLAKITTPSPETERVLFDWLERNGVKKSNCDTVRTRDFWKCGTTVSIAEKLLPGSKFCRFSNGASILLRSATSYHLPSPIADIVAFVGGVHRFPRHTGATQSPAKSVDFHLGVDPSVLRQRYNLSDTMVGSYSNNSQATAQFLEQYFHQDDLAEFMKLFVAYPHRDKVDKVVGPNDGKPGLEASLDIQYITSMGANITTWYWNTPGRDETQEPFIEWLMAITNTTTVPWVHSISYSDYEATLSTAYMKRVSAEFAKAGSRGLSFLFASGDNGAGCRETSKDKYVYNPMFPSSSPWVTTVGGTTFQKPYAISDEETDFISGGGFSTVFPRPGYQDDAVELYLSTSKPLPDQHYFNRNGRAFPDVAALSSNYWIVREKIPTPYISGTSCATPVWAGIISLVNDVRFTMGGSSLGFINPLLYEVAYQALMDVTVGCHVGCLDDEGIEGFCAGVGWDATTGWGTPDVYTMIYGQSSTFV